jgi:hypothetical protein
MVRALFVSSMCVIRSARHIVYGLKQPSWSRMGVPDLRSLSGRKRQYRNAAWTVGSKPVLSREFPHRRIGRARGHGPPTARSSYVDVCVQQHPALPLPAGPWAFHRSDRHCGHRRGLAFSVFGATATARMSKQASAAAPPQSQAWVVWAFENEVDVPASRDRDNETVLHVLLPRPIILRVLKRRSSRVRHQRQYDLQLAVLTILALLSIDPNR